MVYDIRKVTSVIDGTYLTGYSKDKKVSAEKIEDGLIEYIGVDGEVDFSVNANNAGLVKIPLKSTSPSIRYLNGLANKRKIFSLSIIDLNEFGVNATGTQGFVRKAIMPDKSKEISDVEYEIFVGDLEIQ